MLISCSKILPVNEKAAIDFHTFHNRKMGASASEFLNDGVYKSLVVEIQYVAGFKPQQGTVDYLKNFLETYLRKPRGINILLKEIPSIEQNALNKDHVLTIENVYRTRYIQHDQISMYILFTDGVHSGNKILGMAYGNTSAVVYGEAIRKYSNKGGRLTHQVLETAVLLHEIGHLLGLVNKGTPLRSEHVDFASNDHCSNKSCLMYRSVEVKKLSSILRQGNMPVLDSLCIEDLIANGGKNTPDYELYVKPF